jgi:hypothetical protein
MILTEPQIEALAPKPAAYKAAMKIVTGAKCLERGISERALWGSIQGSGKKPYITQIDIQNLAYKCSCPSRQFPCKHALAVLILHSRDKSPSQEEPEWVSEWINNRRSKTKTPKVKKPLSEKEVASRQRSKDKRAEERMAAVETGIAELDKWLQDQIRIGLLELPNRPKEDFNKLAARMVDAKAPGLAGWVRALADIDYGQTKVWQEEATAIIAKMHLLIKTWKNKDNLTPEWQHTLKTLVGWSQSSKNLMSDKTAPAIKDHWLVLGRTQETKDDILIQREWLWGSQSGASTLILNFGTRFQKLEIKLPLASVLEAEVAFFHSILPHRGIIRKQKNISNSLKHTIKMHQDFTTMVAEHKQKLRRHPWASQLCYLVEKLRMLKVDNKWSLCDVSGNTLPLNNSVETIKKWFLYCGNQAVSAAVVYQNNKLRLLGIFSQTKYYALC